MKGLPLDVQRVRRRCLAAQVLQVARQGLHRCALLTCVQIEQFAELFVDEIGDDVGSVEGMEQPFDAP